jgi:acetoacetyl-CoA reductase
MSKRVALVTGGTGTIGTEICRHLGRQGNRIAATCLPVEEEIARARDWEAGLRSEGIEGIFVACELAEFDSTANAMREVEQRLGPVDILVNAAGITRDATLRRMTPQQWHEVVQANLYSVFNTTRNVIEGMLDRGFGRIVNISSVNGQKGQFGQANYAATKAGIHGFTMSIAQEGARKGVTVNTVSPGYIESPMVMAVPEDVRAKIVAQIPVGRLGRPEEVARLVAFLAAEESGYITGADFSINGGLHMG